MSVRGEVELLRRVPLLAEVDRAHLQILAFSAERIEVEPGQYLFEAGSHVAGGFLILSGKGEALKPQDGEIERLAAVEAGAFLAELAMVADLPVTITVKATEPMRALKIGHDLFRRVCGEFPDVGVKVMAALTRKLDTSLEELLAVRDYFDRARPFIR